MKTQQTQMEKLFRFFPIYLLPTGVEESSLLPVRTQGPENEI